MFGESQRENLLTWDHGYRAFFVPPQTLLGYAPQESLFFKHF